MRQTSILPQTLPLSSQPTSICKHWSPFLDLHIPLHPVALESHLRTFPTILLHPMHIDPLKYSFSGPFKYADSHSSPKAILHSCACQPLPPILHPISLPSFPTNTVPIPKRCISLLSSAVLSSILSQRFYIHLGSPNYSSQQTPWHPNLYYYTLTSNYSPPTK